MEDSQGAWNTSLVRNSKRLFYPFYSSMFVAGTINIHKFCRHPQLWSLLWRETATTQSWCWKSSSSLSMDDRNRSSHQQTTKKFSLITASAPQNEMKNIFCKVLSGSLKHSETINRKDHKTTHSVCCKMTSRLIQFCFSEKPLIPIWSAFFVRASCTLSGDVQPSECTRCTGRKSNPIFSFFHSLKCLGFQGYLLLSNLPYLLRAVFFWWGNLIWSIYM